MKNFIKKLLPLWIIQLRRNIINYLTQKRQNKKQNKIRNYFLSLDKKLYSADIAEVITFFTQNSLFSQIPYEFIKKYNLSDIIIYTDKTCEMRYVIHQDKKLYFPKNLTQETIANYYNSLLIEQDKDSPHRYETSDYTVEDGDVIADIGTAEGLWALENIEKAKTAYLFECEESWIPAIQKTFEPWKEKTIIVNKYVSGVTKSNKTTLDDFFKDKPVNFIKADIEGAEIEMLHGAKELFKQKSNLKILLCAYHRKDDAATLEKILKQNNFKTELSKGYITHYSFPFPYLHRGIIRGEKLHT